MDPLEEVLQNYRELVAHLPEPLQPFAVLLIGAIPFIEGEGSASWGVVGGINPIVAGVAGAAGNFLAVLGVVTLSSRARTAVIARRERTSGAPAETKPESKGRQRFRRWVVRFGVPGASIIGPLAIPTHFTSAILVASGTPKRWVLLWQAIAIVLWTTLFTTLSWLAVTAVLA
jgi:hypothetical protein